MKLEKIVFLLTVAVVAAAEITNHDNSEEASAEVSYTESATVTLLKTKLGCLQKQMTVCEALLATATRNCKKRKYNIYIYVSVYTGQMIRTIHELVI